MAETSKEIIEGNTPLPDKQVKDANYYPGKAYQRLFDVINESAPNPLLSQMQDIIHVVHDDFPKKPERLEELKKKYTEWFFGGAYWPTPEQQFNWFVKNF